MHNQDNQTITGHRERTILSFRDRLIVYGGVFLIIAMAWAYMLYMGWAMDNMHLVDMWMPPNAGNHPWSAYDFFMLFIMWLVMMVAGVFGIDSGGSGWCCQWLVCVWNCFW